MTDKHRGRSIALRAAVLAGLVFAVPLPASAQWWGGYYRPPVVMDEMTPREVVHAVHRNGYSQPSRPVYRDDVVLVTATDPRGQRVRLVLDVYSGRIVDRLAAPQARPAPRPREQVVQRAPDQGAVIRRTVPEQETRTRATPERPSTIRREPMLPPQPQQAKPPRTAPPSVAQPVVPSQPPNAEVGSGSRAQPRRIEMTPPAALDAPPIAPPRPTGPPINSVPPASLE